MFRSEDFADHYPVEHWLFGCFHTPADDVGRLFLPRFGEAGEPALHGPVPAGADGLSLFRFEGAALLWVGPGDVPTGVGQSTTSGPGRAPRELPGLRSTSVHAARVSLGLPAGRRRTAHPVRALVGLQFSSSSLWLIRGAR
jgi:hypothetical protein